MRILYLPNAYSQQRQFEKPSNIYPVLLAMQSTYQRQIGHDVSWDNAIGQYDRIVTEPENIPFYLLPAPDRIFTQAKKYTSGNYKYLPGTHMQVANGCWHGKCTFCIEKDRPYEVRNLGDVTDEIIECKRLGFREIFDDSGTFPTGKWLDDFCKLWKYNKAITFGCNMRMVDVDYQAMKNAGFRMLLFGLESANQDTLDRINKGVKVEDYKYIIKARKSGLDCHVAVMFGYPWEKEKDALNTIKLVHELLRKGVAKTAQASFYTVGSRQSNPSHRRFIKSIYNISYSPEFWFNKLKDIKNAEDIKYLWKQIKVGLKEWK